MAALLLGGGVWMAQKKDNQRWLAEKMSDLIGARKASECASGPGYTDKQLDMVMGKIERGLEELEAKYPGMPKVKVTGGLRGIRYFVEFPIVGRNVDAFSLLVTTKQLLEDNMKKWDVRITNTDSYLAEENVAYLIDYLVKSSSVGGTKCKGSIYIRGVKGSEGLDSFKFILEKSNDFSEFDAKLILNAYEQALKPKPGEVAQSPPQPQIDETNMTPA